MGSSATGKDLDVELVLTLAGVVPVTVAECSLTTFSENDNYTEINTQHLGGCENSTDRDFENISGSLGSTVKNPKLLAFRDVYMRHVRARTPGMTVSVNVTHVLPDGTLEYSYALENCNLDFSFDGSPGSHNTMSINYTTTRPRNVILDPFGLLGVPSA